MTAKALQVRNDAFPRTCRKSQFNCSMQYVKMANVCVSVANGQAVNNTRVVEVPFPTNHVAVEAGEELLVEKPEEEPKKKKPPVNKQKSEWKTSAQKKHKSAYE